MSETCCVVLAKPFFKQVKDAVEAGRKELEDCLVRHRKEYDDRCLAREKKTWLQRVWNFATFNWDVSAYDDPQIGLYPTSFVRARSRLNDIENLVPTLLAFPTESHHVRIPHTLYREAVDLGLVKEVDSEEKETS